MGSVDESFRLLMEICDLPEVSRTDFVIKGVAALGNEIDERAAVSAILPHVRKPPAVLLGESALIARFHADSRVKAFAMEQLQEPSPPLVAMAGVYASDQRDRAIDIAACGAVADGVPPIHCEEGEPTLR